MNEEERVTFKAKYTLRGLFGGISISLILLIGIIGGLVFDRFHIYFRNIDFVFFSICFSLLWMRRIIRCIVFNSTTFTVKYYFRPPMKIKYSEIIDIGNVYIETRKEEIGCDGMSNGDGFIHRFQELVEQQQVDPAKFENKILYLENASRKSFVPTRLVFIPLLLVLIFIWPKFHDKWFEYKHLWWQL